jgi:asparagine synthase (glutamine-hydrolysing)
MCGITGIFHFDSTRRADDGVVRRMAGTLAHRGPDGEGFYIRNNVGLGHRRLSIIDLSTGDQPMLNDDGSIVVIFNGEIYNYIELREELTTLGHKFKTTSDTEVIIRAYQQWGTDCQQKFNGMWAIALWDERKQQLFISRDRLGEKPMYYSEFDGTFLFASELKAVLAFGCPAEPNNEITELYLSLGYIPEPYTAYKNIRKLKAGHFLVVQQGGAKESKYWELPLPDEKNMLTDRSKVYATFEELFHDAVRIRMRSDVTFGAFLSGGLDSGSIVSSMSAISPNPVRTFTIGFEERGFDERALAKDVATKFGTVHTEFVVEPDRYDEALAKVLHHYDEPFGDPSAIAVGYVSRSAATRVKMVLTGDGGDEVLSGYNANQAEKFAGQYKRVPELIRRSLPGVLTPLQVFNGNIRYKVNRLKRILEYSQESFESRLLIKSSWYEPQLIREMSASMGKQLPMEDFIADFYRGFPVADPFYKLMMFQHKVVLPDDYLVKVDRMSMAYSLETRVPFLDHRLVEFMIQVSKDVKMNGYERKSVLRNTIGKSLPASVQRTGKKGFVVPLREWFKDRAFDDRLAELTRMDLGLDNRVIKKVVDENLSGKKDHGQFIWMLLVLAGWKKGQRISAP